MHMYQRIVDDLWSNKDKDRMFNQNIDTDIDFMMAVLLKQQLIQTFHKLKIVRLIRE